MASTVVNFPGIPTGLTLTTDVCSPTSLAVEETVTLTEASGIYSGVVAGAIAGQKVFVMKASGTRFGSRVRTIADTVGPFTILSDLEASRDDGRGTYPVTITVNDGAAAVVGASVRVTATGVDATGTTITGGIATLALSNGTYVVTITAVGFEPLIDSLVVSGVSSDAYSLTELDITPPASALVSTGIMVVYDEDGVIESGVPISIQLTSGPGDDGYGWDTKVRTETSAVTTGLVQFTGMIRGATYTVWRGEQASGVTVSAVSGFSTRSSITSVTCVVPDSASFNLPEVIGTDAEA